MASERAEWKFGRLRYHQCHVQSTHRPPRAAGRVCQRHILALAAVEFELLGDARRHLLGANILLAARLGFQDGHDFVRWLAWGCGVGSRE